MTKAVIVELHGNDNSGDVVRYTVADGNAISKGTLCFFTDPRTASASTSTTNGMPFAGIANADKEASDGSTTLGMYTRGIFDITVTNTAIVAGAIVAISGADLVRVAADADQVSGAVVGRLLESASANEVATVIIGGGY